MISKALVVSAYHTKLSELIALGVDLHVVIPKSWGSYIPENPQGKGYKIHRLPVYFSGKNHFHFYTDLRETIESIRPDLLHVDEEPYSFVTYQAMKIVRRNRYASLFFTWQNIYKKYPFPFSSIEQYNYSVASVAIAGNDDAKEVLGQKGFSKDIFIIPQFGVDPQLYSRRDVSMTKKTIFGSSEVPAIGFIGRLVEEKGILDLVEAFSRIRENPNLLIIGNGPLKPKIILKAQQLSVLERVRLIDCVPSKDIPQYLNLLDCLILPSLTRPNWKEQFGRVLIEAMACEVPVIGSTSGEIPRVIGNAGLIFREGDITDLQQKIEMIIFDNHLKEKLRNDGLLRVREQFTQQSIASQTYQVYRKVLKDHSG